jgi:hypothetical protein
VVIGSPEDIQGQEKKAIFLTTVRSSREYLKHDQRFGLGFLNHARRLNTCITRAQALLVVVGNPRILYQDRTFRALIDYCRDNNSTKGFSDDILKIEEEEEEQAKENEADTKKHTEAKQEDTPTKDAQGSAKVLVPKTAWGPPKDVVTPPVKVNVEPIQPPLAAAAAVASQPSKSIQSPLPSSLQSLQPLQSLLTPHEPASPFLPPMNYWDGPSYQSSWNPMQFSAPNPFQEPPRTPWLSSMPMPSVPGTENSWRGEFQKLAVYNGVDFVQCDGTPPPLSVVENSDGVVVTISVFNHGSKIKADAALIHIKIWPLPEMARALYCSGLTNCRLVIAVPSAFDPKLVEIASSKNFIHITFPRVKKMSMSMPNDPKI